MKKWKTGEIGNVTSKTQLDSGWAGMWTAWAHSLYTWPLPHELQRWLSSPFAQKSAYCRQEAKLRPLTAKQQQSFLNDTPRQPKTPAVYHQTRPSTQWLVSKAQISAVRLVNRGDHFHLAFSRPLWRPASTQHSEQFTPRSPSFSHLLSFLLGTLYLTRWSNHFSGPCRNYQREKLF